MNRTRNVIILNTLLITFSFLLGECGDGPLSVVPTGDKVIHLSNGVNTGTRFDRFVSDFIAQSGRISENETFLDSAGWNFGGHMAASLNTGILDDIPFRVLNLDNSPAASVPEVTFATHVTAPDSSYSCIVFITAFLNAEQQTLIKIDGQYLLAGDYSLLDGPLGAAIQDGRGFIQVEKIKLQHGSGRPDYCLVIGPGWLKLNLKKAIKVTESAKD